jgi:hypothetical protein
MLLLWLPPCILDRIQNSTPWTCIWEPSKNFEFVIVVASLGHHGSCAILLFCYANVFYFKWQRKTVLVSRTMRQTHIDMTPTSGSSVGERRRESRPQRESRLNRQTFASSVITSVTAIHYPQSVDYGGVYGADLPDFSDISTAMPSDNTSGSAPQVSSVDSLGQTRVTIRRDRNVFVTLTYIIVGYLLCWVPFHVVFDISAVNPTAVPDIVYTITFWMTYINSTINPLLYNFSNAAFRAAFKKMLCIK